MTKKTPKFTQKGGVKPGNFPYPKGPSLEKFQDLEIFKLSVPKTLRFENTETLRFLFRGPKNR